MDMSKVKVEEFPGGIVKATISNCELDAFYKLHSKFISNTTSEFVVMPTDNVSSQYLMNYKYSAIAKCSKDDEYDFNIGKQIAIKRLSEKYNSAVDRRIARFLMSFDKTLRNMDKYFEGREF